MDFPPFPPVAGVGLLWDGTLPSGAQSGEGHATGELPLPVRPAHPVSSPFGEEAPQPDGALTLESSDAFTLSLSESAREALFAVPHEPLTPPSVRTAPTPGIPTPPVTPAAVPTPTSLAQPSEPGLTDALPVQTVMPSSASPLVASDAPIPLSTLSAIPQPTPSATPLSPVAPQTNPDVPAPSPAAPADTQLSVSPTQPQQTSSAAVPIPAQSLATAETLLQPRSIALPPELPPLPRTAMPFAPHQAPEVSAAVSPEPPAIANSVITASSMTSAVLTKALTDRPPLFSRILQPPFPLYLFGNVTVTTLLHDAEEDPPPRRPRAYDDESGSPLDERAPLRTGEAVKLACILHDLHRGGSAAFPAHISPWYAPYVHYAVQNKLMQPDFFTDFAAPITRGELARLLSSALPTVSLRSARDTFCGRFALEDTLPRMEASLLISRLARS